MVRVCGGRLTHLLQYLLSKCTGQNTFHDICMLLINKTEITNTGHLEARISICCKKNVYMPSLMNLQEFFIAANTQIITSSLLIIF